MITFIVANRNRREFVEACIDSYKSLSFPKELIVVDAKSNDGSCEILRESADILICEGDSSVYEAWNKAIILAKGEWIFFLNTDDIMITSGFTKIAERLHGLKTDIVYGDVEVTKVSEGHIRRKRGRRFSFRQVISNPIYFNRFIFRKSVFERVGNFDDLFRFCADQDFIWRCLDSGISSTYFKETIYRYNIHDQSLTLSRSLNFSFEEHRIAKKNFRDSVSESGKKMSKVWVFWEEISMDSQSRVMKVARRLCNRALFMQQIYSFILKISHQ